MTKWARVVKRVIFFIAVFCFLLCIWKISVSGGTRPIEQKTQDGYFQGMDSPIRGIRIYVETQYRDLIEESSEFTLWITDEDGETIFEETYDALSLKDGEFLILEEFERGQGIEIGAGRYQIHDTIIRDERIRISYKILIYNGNYRQFYFICLAVALVFLAVFLAFTMRKTGKYELAFNYFAALLLMGVLFSIVMPPLTVPDEESHFRKAYDLSSQITFQDRELMRKTDNDSIIYLHNVASIGRWYADFSQDVDTGEMVNTKWSSVPGTTPFYAYLFPAIGISIGRLLGLNGNWVILLGRLCNMLGVAAIMAIALQLIPFGKKFFCVLLLLPEVVYLTASYSYDALNLALCFLAISYFFYMIWDEKPVKIKNIVLFMVILLIMIPIKMVYAPFIGLLLLIPRKQLEINRKILMGAGALTVLGILLFLIWRWEDIVVLLRGLDYNTEEEARVSLGYMLQNPKNAVFVFFMNLMKNIDYYLQSIMGEFVGRDRYEILLDRAYLPEWMMIVLSIMLALGIYTDDKIDLKAWKKGWAAFLGVASCLLIFLSMYLANNTVRMDYIHGVQGRYFLPVLLLLPAIAGKKRSNVEPGRVRTGENTYMIIMMGINIAAVFMGLWHLIVSYFG